MLGWWRRRRTSESSRVWNDSCDVGLAVVAVNSEVIFTLQAELRDEEKLGRPLVGWQYIEYRVDGRPGRTLIIFND